MLKYIIKRILVFIPTLIAITLLAFIIIINAPGDPVERMVVAAQSGGEIGSQSANMMEQKKFWKRKLGLDLPVFYFSLSSLAEPDTLYKVFDKNEKNALGRLIDQYGNWNEIDAYFTSLNILYAEHQQIKTDSTSLGGYNINDAKEAINVSLFETLSLRSTSDDRVVSAKIEKLKMLHDKFSFLSFLKPSLEDAIQKYADVKAKETGWKNYVPYVHFYSKNQYHRWMFGDGNWLTAKGSEFSQGILRGDFGTSYTTKQPISEVIKSKIGWSLFFTMISVFLGYLVSIPLGLHSAVHKGSRFDRVSTVLLFILYSMPSFWVATLLLMTFANPDVFHIFPASGVMPATGYPLDATFFDKVRISMPYLILPIICYSYSSFAFLSRTMRVSMLEIVNQDYIRTARAKGLPLFKVVYKHGLRNALLPIITVFANIFPIAIGGSVILEWIFTIPGMGNEIFTAITNQNYPMIIAVFTITGVLTLIGYLVSDILYAVVDPRISFSK